MPVLRYATFHGAILNALTSVTPMKALELVTAAGISDAGRILADFAAGGLVKSYALVMTTIDARGASNTVRGPGIPAEVWRRIIRADAARDAWASGTVRLAGSDLVGGDPAVEMTGITFKRESIDWVIAHHADKPPARGRREKVAAPETVSVDEAEAEQAPLRPKKHAGDMSAIPPGAMLVTVEQAMRALGKSRGTIMNLIRRGALTRRNTGLRTVDIEAASIRAFAGVKD